MRVMRPQGVPQKGLYDLISYIGHTTKLNMVEVGCYAGESSLIFGYHFNKIFCVDAWSSDLYKNKYREDMSEVEKAFDRRMDELDNFTKMKMISTDAAKFFGEKSLDFVYIDASHNYRNVVRDIDAWLPKIKPGGFIGGHDYHHTSPGVREAVIRKFNGPDRVFADKSWIVKIKEQPKYLFALKEQEMLQAA